MLSILIPTYNYNVIPLVEDVKNQCIECGLIFEILVYDDGSKSSINIKNKTINLLEHCVFKELPQNIGRSAIRNLLAKNAMYENLLFLDADVLPSKKTFIKNYFNNLNEEVIIGGITNTYEIPKKPYKLRWLYTKARETRKGLHSANFIIKKKIIELKPFDETLTKYGCEDVLFFEALNKDNIKIKHIDNPIIHYGNDDANTFIKKTEQAIENLIHLIDEKKLQNKHYKVSIGYQKLKKLKLHKLVAYTYKLSKPLLIRNFNSSLPSIFLYDFYRLGYFCKIKTNL